MGKKVVMSLAACNERFGGDPTSGMLPSASTGKDFAKGSGKGKGFRDFQDSRGEQDEWRTGGSKGGGKSFGGGGGGFGGGRDQGGGMPMGSRGARGGDERDTAAGKDDDWRGGGARAEERPRPGEERPRPGRSGTGGFGDREARNDGPSERPRLNLKPRSAGPGNATASSAASAAKDDGFTTVKKTAAAPAPGKYVPPSQRKKIEEEEARALARRRGEEEHKTADGGSGYVPPHVKKAQDEEARKREAKETEAREKQMAAEEADRAEKAAKRAAKEKKKADKADAKEKFDGLHAEPDRTLGKKDGDYCEEKLLEFSKECSALLANAKADVEAKVAEMTAKLTASELRTVQPMTRLLELMLQACRRQADGEVVRIVQRFAPVFKALIEKAGVHRFKVKVLCEAQRLASQMGLPRLSPESALLEVFFDGLYRAEIVEEEYFNLWAMANDDTPGKMNAMFQVSAFLDWLRNATIEGEESSESEGESGEEEEQSEDDEEGSDIEANVPKRGGQR